MHLKSSALEGRRAAEQVGGGLKLSGLLEATLFSPGITPSLARNGLVPTLARAAVPIYQ